MISMNFSFDVMFDRHYSSTSILYTQNNTKMQLNIYIKSYPLNPTSLLNELEIIVILSAVIKCHFICKESKVSIEANIMYHYIVDRCVITAISSFHKVYIQPVRSVMKGNLFK